MTTPTPADALRDVIEALDACPFCGHGESLYIEHVDGTILHPAYYVRCDYCGAQSGASDKGDHIEQWNRRAHAGTLRRALATLAAVEAAPVVSFSSAGTLQGDIPLGWRGQRVALVRVGEG